MRSAPHERTTGKRSLRTVGTRTEESLASAGHERSTTMNAGLKNHAGTEQTLRQMSRWTVAITALLTISSAVVRADDAAVTKNDTNTTVVAATVTAGGVAVTPPVVTPLVPTPGQTNTQIALQNYRPHDQ